MADLTLFIARDLPQFPVRLNQAWKTIPSFYSLSVGSAKSCDRSPDAIAAGYVY